MTNKEAKEQYEKWEAIEEEEAREYFERRKQPCEDCISRQAAVDCFKKWQPYMATRLLDFEKELSELPSVTPQPKMGKWIIIDDCEQFIAKCSECGRIEDSRMISKYPYCHCGAKMEVGE